MIWAHVIRSRVIQLACGYLLERPLLVHFTKLIRGTGHQFQRRTASSHSSTCSFINISSAVPLLQKNGRRNNLPLIRPFDVRALNAATRPAKIDYVGSAAKLATRLDWHDAVRGPRPWWTRIRPLIPA